MNSEQETQTKIKIKINKVTNRFLPLTESVKKGLEPEAKFKDFTILSTIGVGSFGKVYKVIHNTTKQIYAIKSISKLDKNNQEGKTYFRREIEIMYKVHQCNIVRLFNHFEDDEYCYFVMEYIENGSLFSQPFWIKNKCFPSNEVAKIMKDVICAVYYLHNMDPPIIHRDIKPENVLIDKNGVAKLTDFGWSNYVDSNEVRKTYCGTPVYLAPEIVEDVGHDEHVDIWCIGVLIFELLTGTVPFKGRDSITLNNNIKALKIVWPNDISNTAKNLITKILKKEPKERISLEDMLKHPFFKDKLKNDNLGKDLIKPKNIKYPPFLLSKYSIDHYDKIILPNFYKEKNLNNIKEENQQIKEINNNNDNQESIKLNEKNNIKNENENTLSNYNKDAIDNNFSTPMSSINNNLKSIENYNKQVNEAFTMNEGSMKIFNEQSEIAHESVSSYGGKESITSSLGGENLSQLYSSLKKDYDKLSKKYNEIVIITQEQKQKIEELNSKINLLLKEKDNLLKENEQIITEKLNLKTDLEIKKQNLELKEFSIKKLKNNILDNAPMENIQEMEKIIQEKNEEIKKLEEKINQLSLKNDDSEISTTTTTEHEENKNIMKIMEDKLNKANEKIAKLTEELKKEKDNNNLIVRVKNDEIEKLIKNKDNKKYEDIISKYEQIAKEKDTEIEVLKLKNKKLSMINKMLQSKQDNDKK